MKHVWETTHQMYKTILSDWHKGTGGGSGVSTLFEGWSDEKLEKHNIDLDEYDHTDVANCPAILLSGYTKHRVPYITIIHLWDKASDYLLSSRHDPLKIGNGEPGMGDDTTAVTFSSGSVASASVKTKASWKNRKHSNDLAVEGMMKSVVAMCESNTGGGTMAKGVAVARNNSNLLLENLPLAELFALIEQHKLHLKFLEDTNSCSEIEKSEIISDIKGIFKLIKDRSGVKRVRSDDNLSSTGVSD